MKINSKRLCSQILIVTFFIVSIFAIYYQVINFEFNGYDDPQYVINNPMVEKGITLDSMRWAFTSIGYASNWHPLTWLSHMLDVEFFNMNPGMHHLTNVFLHIANSLLLFFIILSIKLPMDRYSLFNFPSSSVIRARIRFLLLLFLMCFSCLGIFLYLFLSLSEDCPLQGAVSMNKCRINESTIVFS